MGRLQAIGVMVGLACFLAACDGFANAPDQQTAPLGAPEAVAPPPPPPQGSFLAQLTPEQTAQLQALGVDVVVPGVVPPSFGVVDIRGRAAGGSGPDQGAAYILVYRDGANRCFAIEFAASGIGDPPSLEQRLPIAPPLFVEQGYGLNYGPYEDEGMRSQDPSPQLYTDWLVGPAGAYRLIGAAYLNQTLPMATSCQDITPQEAVQIVESLTVLAPGVVKDGDLPQ
jgi:hypothetical protein